MTTLTSGDLAADRRYLWAEASRKDGDLAAAADLFGQALDCAPHWAAAAFALGDCLEALGQREEAAAAFERCRALAPDDPFGASLRLARLGARPAPAQMPDRYVARLFDDYADRFDSHLVGALAYRGPAILCGLLDRVSPPRPGAGLGRVIDLGCGTGLMATALAGRATAIDGIDLSPRMISHARAGGLYRHLMTGDMSAVLDRHCAAGDYDLALAADVLVYVGALDPVLAAVHRVLTGQGLLLFSVQAADEAFCLGPDLRYAHSPSYITGSAQRSGFDVLAIETAVTRTDGGRDVPGLAVALRRR